MKSSKAGSYHLLSCIRFQFSFIVPNLKHVRIHSTHPCHSLSLSTFLSRISWAWENTLRTSKEYTPSGDRDCTLLITLASSGRAPKEWQVGQHHPTPLLISRWISPKEAQPIFHGQFSKGHEYRWQFRGRLQSLGKPRSMPRVQNLECFILFLLITRNDARKSAIYNIFKIILLYWSHDKTINHKQSW